MKRNVVSNENEELTFAKQSSPYINGDGIVVSVDDNSIDIVGIGKLSGFFLGLLIDILNLINQILGIVSRVAGIAYNVLSIIAFIVGIFDEELGATLDELAGFAATIASIAGTASQIIGTVASVLEFFYNLIKSKVRDATEKAPFTKLIENFASFFQRFPAFRTLFYKINSQPIVI